MTTNNPLEKKFYLAKDVITSAGADAIKEMQDKTDDIINTIYFDRQSLTSEEKKDPYINEFMQSAQQGKPIENQGYLKDNVRIFLRAPENYEDIITITANPFTREDLRDKNPKDIQRPEFLYQSPDILEKGIVTQKIDGNPKKLENRLSLDYFDLKNPFINQFVLVKTQNEENKHHWPDTIYQIKQDMKETSPDRFTPTSEPYLLNLLPNEHYIYGAQKNLFGITTNSLNQYLALEHLLFDDNIKLVILTGKAGTGKTLMPYIAGLAQTFYQKTKGSAPIPGKFERMILTKADNMMGGREIGFMPGDEQEKISPIIESYQGLHETLDIPFSWEELLTLPDSNKARNYVETRADYSRGNKKPVLYPKHSGFLRGLTLSDSWYIVDETQNFTRREAKDFIARVGKGSKMIICGDVRDQIDNRANTAEKNGMVWAAHGHLSVNNPHIGLMHFNISERSPIAEYNNRISAPRD